MFVRAAAAVLLSIASIRPGEETVCAQRTCVLWSCARAHAYPPHCAILMYVFSHISCTA